ncbi:MAG: CoA transferase [Dehalococcoidales bacterium]|nr:CoA transferase [Dehalococcoidales bacterium]
MAGVALAGIKVVEYTTMVAGPYCGKLLADLGADVIKVEPPEGDPARAFGPFPDDKPHPEKSALFLYNNTSKRGITLNLKTAEGKELFTRLIQWADALIDNYPPGHLASIGFNDEVIQKLNPRLIHTSITPYGRTGPRAQVKGDELTLAHASGLGNLLPVRSVDTNRAPVKPGGFQIAYQSALNAAVVTMAALIGRGKTGKGRIIDVSMQEAIMGLLRPGIASSRYQRATWSRVPDRPPAMGRMKTSDGYLVLGAVEDNHFRILREMMGNPPWMAGDQWLNMAYRSHHLMDIAPMMDAWMEKQNMKEISEKLAKQGVPIGPINSIKDVMENKQYAFRHYFTEVEHPATGKYKYPGWPYLMTASPPQVSRPAPLLGQHNEEVICRELNYSREGYRQLRKSGAFRKIQR